MMISVIIPVYNIENKVKKFKTAVMSVLNQTYSDLELIVVNDGSKDRTGDVLLQLQKTDKRVKIITKENGGVESSRRMGLGNAQGSYVLHMDQDDIYRKDAFEIFVRKMEETKADVVIANHIRFFFCSSFAFGKCTAPSMLTENVIDHDTFMNKYFISFFGMNDLPVNIWNKMYRRDFLSRIPTPPKTGQIIEDLSYNMHVLPYAEKIAIIPDVLYYYRWGGFTNRYDKTILDTAFIGYKLKMAQIEKYELFSYKAYVAVEFVNYLNTYFYQIVEYGVLDKDGFIREARRVLSLSDVQESLAVVKNYDRYHKVYVNAMLNRNYDELYQFEVAEKKKNWKKIFAKKLLLNI